jgi:hypothetical protein
MHIESDALTVKQMYYKTWRLPVVAIPDAARNGGESGRPLLRAGVLHRDMLDVILFLITDECGGSSDDHEHRV